jgi:NAD(P)-dependent dehydrogenase (short-subunit alcohol dehydrogenase family)
VAELDGRVAMVTGGGRGIGRTISQMQASAGAAVTVAGRAAATLDEDVTAIKAAGGHAIPIPTDVTDRTAVERMVQRVTDQVGPVDGCIATGGVIAPIQPLLDADLDAWWHAFAINVRATAACLRAVLPGMVARGKRTGHGVVRRTERRRTGFFGRPRREGRGAAPRRGARCREGAAQRSGLRPVAWPGAQRQGRRGGGIPERTLGSVPPAVFTPAERTGEAWLFLAAGRGDGLSGRLVRVVDDDGQAATMADTLRREASCVLRYRTVPGSPPGDTTTVRVRRLPCSTPLRRAPGVVGACQATASVLLLNADWGPRTQPASAHGGQAG